MPGWWQSIVLIMIIDCNAWEVGGRYEDMKSLIHLILVKSPKVGLDYCLCGWWWEEVKSLQPRGVEMGMETWRPKFGLNSLLCRWWWADVKSLQPRGDGDGDMKSQVWLNLFPSEMMMSRCQVFAAAWKQEKGWLLYLRSLPQGMTNNSGRPLFPKLSRYKQIVIVKLLNFGQFAAFIWQQKSRHRQQNPSNSEEEFWTFCVTFCVTAAIPLKSGLRKHKRMKHGHFFLTEDWHRPEMRVACDMECVSPCYLIVQPCKKLYKGVTRLVKSCIRVWMLARSCIRVVKTQASSSGEMHFHLQQNPGSKIEVIKTPP